MPDFQFYSRKEDIANIVDFMFESCGLKIYESYSKIDTEIVEFKCGDDLLNYSELEDQYGGVNLSGWFPTVTSEKHVHKFKLDPGVGNYRFCIEGVGGFGLSQGKFKDLAEDSLDWSSFSHYSEAGARQRAYATAESLDRVDWKRFKQLSGKVQRHIKKISVGTYNNQRHILPHAYEYLKQGGKIWGGPGIYTIDSEKIILK